MFLGCFHVGMSEIWLPLSFEDRISQKFLEKDRKIKVVKNYWSGLIPKEDNRNSIDHYGRIRLLRKRLDKI